MGAIGEHSTAEDLRSRRRRETSIEICLAALELFEHQGVAGTTVDEIAERAGVSVRTFFRLAGAKEDAVFVDDGRFAHVIDEMLGSGTDAGGSVDLDELISLVQTLPLRALEELDADVDARGRFLRTRRLIAHEPSLFAAAVRRDQAISDQIARALIVRAGCDEFVARATADFTGLAMRLTLDEWARQDIAGRGTTLADIYRAVVGELARIASRAGARPQGDRMHTRATR